MRSKYLVGGFCLVLMLVLAACGSNQSNQAEVAWAAKVGTVTLPEQELTQEVVAIQARSTGAKGTTPNAASTNQINEVVLDRFIRRQLVGQLAEQRGITASDAEIEADYNADIKDKGGQAAYEAYLLSIGIAADQGRDLSRWQVLRHKIGEQQAPGQTVEAQEEAAYQALVKFSQEIGVSVNPTYGYWDAEMLSVRPNPVSGSPSASSSASSSPSVSSSASPSKK